MDRSLSRDRWTLAAFFLVLAGAGAAGCVYLLSIPPDAKHAFILGFSLQRLLLFLFIALPSTWALYAGIRAAVRPLWVLYRLEPAVTRLAEKRWFFIIGGLIFLLGWIALFLPPYWFGIRRAYYIRLRPDLIWLVFWGGFSVSVLWIWKRGWRPGYILDALRSDKGLNKASLVAAGILLIFWLVAAVTGLGITPDALFWNEAGAPLLTLQLIFTLLIFVIFRRLLLQDSVKIRKVWVDLALVACIWLAAFLLWQFTPMPRSYNAPGPYQPNNIYYPYADAESYDTSAQYLLMGHGIANGDLMDKPAYSLILAVLHLVAGQNYSLLITLQVGLMAFVPVGLYLLGRTIHGQETGLLAALFAIFQQRNAIAATVDISVATSKLLLSEYPGAMALIFLSLVIVRWFQAPESRMKLALIAGGLLGLAALIRPNAMILAPILLALMLIRLRKSFKRGILASGLFVITFLAVFVPWNLVIPRGMQYPYLVFKAKALFETRYQVSPQSNSGNNSINPQIPLTDGASLRLASAKPVTAAPIQGDIQTEDPSLAFIPRHYFHNEIMAFMILPHTFELHDLAHTLQTPYWQKVDTWTGELPFGSILLVALNIGLVAVGIGLAWRRWRLAGLIPLVVHVSYYLANALVRNSGSRYLVPVDWVLLLYYALGIVQVLKWLRLAFQSAPDITSEQQDGTVSEVSVQATSGLSWRRGVMIGVIFLTLGSAVPLSRYLFQDQFPVENQAQILTELQNLNYEDSRALLWIDKIATSPPDIQAAIFTIYGRGLYPRWYPAGKSEPGGELDGERLPRGDISRLTLRLLAPDNQYWAILPMLQSPVEFPDGARTAVIGCIYGSNRYIDAAAVVVMTDPAKIYWRSPSTGLTCPLPLP